MRPSAFNFDERPFLIIWETTQACRLACQHCRAEAIPASHPLQLNTAEARKLLDQVARCKPALFVLTGGDPMERNDLAELIDYATGTGLRVALSPSATPRFLEADFDDLKRRGVSRISLSLDGATRETHDRFRGVPGTWDWTMTAIERIREAGIPLQINTTFSRTNITEFDRFVRLLEEIDPVLWSVFLLVPTGRAQVRDMLDALATENLFLRLYHLSRQASFDIKTTEAQHYRRVMLQQSHGRANAPPRAPLGINDGKGFVFVSHMGNICPSGFLPLAAGNVRTDELLAIYQHHPLFRQLRDPSLLKGKCGACEFNRICGGSRSRAYALTGDPMGEETTCSYQPRRVRPPKGPA